MRSWFFALFIASLFALRAEDVIVFREGLAINSVGRIGRNAFHTDAIEQLIVQGQWHRPVEGDSLTRADGTNRVWKSVMTDKEGNLSGPELRGGYVYWPVAVEAAETRILDASGHGMVYVNGEPRAGDPYSNGSLELPVALHAGTNDLLFSVGRGRLSAKLVPAKGPVFLSARDATLPDIVRGEADDLWCALPIINATDKPLHNLLMIATTAGVTGIEVAVPLIAPMTVRKVPFKIRPFTRNASNSVEYVVSLKRSGQDAELDTANVTVRIRNPKDHYKQTFRSDIDGSIQYYAVVPPNPLPKKGEPAALFLSTHGAGVEAMGQADAYAAKSWGYLIAPTNRRPYGFDWEDWGRRDGIEVLNLAQKRFGTDPAQTYLTGHSMGGHGAWQLGVTFPDRFAAIAPSAGWISFWSYAGASRNENPSKIEELIQRAGTASDTLALASNYLQQAIYILHGDKDDNVPVSEARKMKERLSEFHRDFMYHEQPGAGHWWGSPCVDWPPIFDLFARHKIPTDSMITKIQFSTANPAVSSSDHWITIEGQERCLARSSVDISYDAGARQFTGTTENVARLALRTAVFRPNGKVTVELDGDKLAMEGIDRGDFRLERREGHWTIAPQPDYSAKGPLRNGPFKEAFNHRMIFVYSTKGTAEENAWSYDRARFDAESWLYRGNGAVDVIADSEFDSAVDPDRAVILYGNADNNGAWAELLGKSPVQVKRGVVKIGSRETHGEDLACMFLRPRSGSGIALVGVVSGTGMSGLRLTDRVPYFLAGVAFPDCTVFGVETLREGAKGVRTAGYFGDDWSVEHGEFAWAE